MVEKRSIAKAIILAFCMIQDSINKIVDTPSPYDK